MEKPRTGGSSVRPRPGRVSPEAEARGEARERHAGGLRHERDRARGARVHLENEKLAAADCELHVHEPHDLERQPEPGRGLPDFAESRARHAPVRRQDGVRIARMDAGLLDVLHDPGDDDVLSVAEGVDVELVGILEKPVDQDRAGPERRRSPPRGPPRGRPRRRRCASRGRRARSSGGREAESRGGRPTFRPSATSRATPHGGACRFDVTQQLAEALAVLGAVDRVRRGAEDRNAGGLERLRELQRRLAAELHEDAVRLLAFDDGEDVLERERLEVEPVGRVVVRRDRLGVAVDHHGLVAGLGDRLGRVHAAVVELEALPDPVRAGAEDDDLLPAGRDRPRPPSRSRNRGTGSVDSNSAAHVSTRLKTGVTP